MNLLSRIRKTIERHHLIERGDTLIVGVSGGPDSLALLHILRALRGEYQAQIHVAHLNHQLRGSESNADAEFVSNMAKGWQLASTIESRDVMAHARQEKLSNEEAARDMRYEFFAEIAVRANARTVAVAHNADDQTETVLMHLLRGAGMAGLRGMKFKSQFSNTNRPAQIPNLYLIRPLLDTSRDEIVAYCRENALVPRIDSTNLDTTIFRNRLRHEVMPYLETLNPNLRRILLRTSSSLADDYDFMQAHAREAFERVAHEQNGSIIFDRRAWRRLHPSLQRATLRLAFERLRGNFRNLAWAHIEDAREIALGKDVGAEATLPRGLRLRVGYEEFSIVDEASQGHIDLPQLNVECLPLPMQGRVQLPGSEWAIELGRVLEAPENIGEPWSAAIDADQIDGGLYLRQRNPGDTFQPAGLGGHRKSLHEFMIDKKIPQRARTRLPLLCDQSKILWVCGYRLDERARAKGNARSILFARLGRPGRSGSSEIDAAGTGIAKPPSRK